ncbi:hypothetical protein [Sphaerisporangium sp. NPDC051011]|uniref:hypothetical protein n=1 Tax=Sphaerisporangium sp. NPDC051011 TaxID=3155792 RepID=UPI0033C52520
MVRVESITTGDEQPQLVSAYRIASGDMVYAVILGRGEFEERRGQIGDMHGTSHVEAG